MRGIFLYYGTMKLFAIILFVATYVALMIFQNQRAWIALGSAVIFLISGILTPGAAISSVDWNVILMLFGTMGTVSLFIESKMPSRLSDLLLQKVKDARWAIVFISLFSGFISAFVDNVATVLMLAPVGFAICKKLGLNPIPVIIAISVSSNLQGAATLVGDTTSILLGGYADMSFIDFFFMNGKLGIFFAVELGAVATMFVLLFLFRREKKPISAPALTPVEDKFPTVLLVGTIVLLIVASFLPNTPALINGIICTALFLIGLVRRCIQKKSFLSIKDTLKDVDYFTLLLLAGLFIVIEGITEAGVITDIGNLFLKVSGDNLFVAYTLIVFISVLLSAFIDNIPYVATMLPVVAQMASTMGMEPYVLFFGLLIGATLGGNLTPIGASANITAIGILKKNGYTTSTKDFMRIGLPFTLVAVLTGYLFVWFVWA